MPWAHASVTADASPAEVIAWMKADSRVPLSKIFPNTEFPSLTGQFHRLDRNWCLHSSMDIFAPNAMLGSKSGNSLQSFFCLSLMLVR